MPTWRLEYDKIARKWKQQSWNGPWQTPTTWAPPPSTLNTLQSNFKGQPKPPPTSNTPTNPLTLLPNAISLHTPPPPLSSPSSMSPPPPPPPLLLLLLLPAVLLICSGHLPATLSAGVTFFPNCNRTFSCGSLQNITYPFTGGDRPEHCGLPGFRLICRDGYAELNMKSLIYRVLRIDQTGKNLTLTRLDLWNNTCPSQFANSTLNFTIFNYGVGNEELNLFYGCDSVKTPSNQFNCNASGSASGNSSYAYYLIGPVPDPILKIIRCNTSLRIPVLQSAANSLTANNITLGEVLTVGFNVNYSNPCEAKCSACIAYGAQCGYDYDKEEPICICSDRICHVRGIRACSMLLIFLCK